MSDTRRPTTRKIDRLLARLVHLPQPNAVRKDAVGIPLRDGVRLAADLFTPAVPSKGVVLVRSPYGRGALMHLLFAYLWAGQGYTVLCVASRGTAGSEGVFEPMRDEASDGHDVVTWLREQSWYPGTFATLGHSYLSFTQWAILSDPPADLVAAIVMEGPHDFSRHSWGTGSFHFDFIGWEGMFHMINNVSVRELIASRGRGRRRAEVLHATPVVPASDAFFAERAPWMHERLVRDDLRDPFYATTQHADALETSTVPTLVVAGWQDIFLGQSMQQYRRLHARGVETRLIAGAWTHTSPKMYRVVAPDIVAWLDAHLAGVGTPRLGVDVEVTPTGGWTHLDQWPPADSRTLELYPATSSVLAAAPSEGGASSSFRYDPDEPTPSIGGNELSGGGYVDDSSLASRPDVLHFDTAPLDEDVLLMGAPTVRLSHASERPDADVFVRVSDVSPDGTSRNVTEAFLRVQGDHDTVELDLYDAAHLFAAGHRIRLYVAGGWFPAYSRNPGTGENPLTAERRLPNRHTVRLGADTVVVLPTRPTVTTRL